MNFTIEGGNIRYGLGSLKGVSDKTIEKLLGFRKAYANRFEVFEAAEQCKINIGVLSCLIQSGCLGAGIERSSLVYEAQLYRLLTPTEKKYVHAIYQSMGEKLTDLRDILHYMIKNKNDKGKPYIKESRVETLKRRSAPYKEIYKKNSEHEKLAIYYYEKQNVGYPYTYSLRDLNLEFKEMLDTIYAVKNNKDINERIFSVCEVVEAAKRMSKKGSYYLKMLLQDETGTLEAMAFNTQRTATVDLIEEENGGIIPKPGDIVFIKGKKQEDVVYLDRCDIQNFKIYTKLSELKNDFKEEETLEKTPTKQ
jgi:DNA polymerase III alpha subunit